MTSTPKDLLPNAEEARELRDQLSFHRNHYDANLFYIALERVHKSIINAVLEERSYTHVSPFLDEELNKIAVNMIDTRKSPHRQQPAMCSYEKRIYNVLDILWTRGYTLSSEYIAKNSLPGVKQLAIRISWDDDYENS